MQFRFSCAMRRLPCAVGLVLALSAAPAAAQSPAGAAPSPAGAAGAADTPSVSSGPAPCRELWGLLAQERAVHERRARLTEMTDQAARRMDERLLADETAATAEATALGLALAAAQERCAAQMRAMQTLSDCDQIPYLQQALDGAQALMRETAQGVISRGALLDWGGAAVLAPSSLGPLTIALPSGPVSPDLGGGLMEHQPTTYLQTILERLRAATESCARTRAAAPVIP